MIKLKKDNKRAAEEEKKKEESPNEASQTVAKKSPGEIRIQKELGELDIPSHAQLKFRSQNDIMNFNLVVDLSRENCFWQGGKYEFTIEVSPNYPHDPPKCLCITPIYHPNIDLQGHVCLNILRDDWRPVLGINAVILGLIFLFIEPNPNDPLNKEAAEIMRKNEA